MTEQTAVRIGSEVVPARVATSWWEETRGLMGRFSPPEFAMVFCSSRPRWHTLHMVGVGTPLDAVFARDGEVVRVARLSPWVGGAIATADVVVELAAGEVDVDVGEELVVGSVDRPGTR